MRLLADENIQPDTVRLLRERGFDVLGAFDAGLGGAPDPRVFAEAQRLERMLLTYNAHFADLRALAAQRHHGIVRLRFSNQRVDFVHPRLLAALEKLGQQDLRDTLVTLTDDSIRLRKTLSL